MRRSGFYAKDPLPIEEQSSPCMEAAAQPYMGCSIAYPGATPEQVEQQIKVITSGDFLI